MAMPAFKPSGQGLQKDLVQIQIGNAIAWGSHKSKLRKLMSSVVGTQIVNGVEVYNNIDLLGNICMENSDLRELLELYGFTDEDFEELCNINTENDLDQFMILWNGTMSVLEKDYKFIIESAKNTVSNMADQITITSSPKRYPSDNTDVKVPQYTNDYGINAATIDSSYDRMNPPPPMWETQGAAEIINSQLLMSTFVITFTKNGTDVTSSMPEYLPNAVLAMALLEPNTMNSTSKSFIERNEGGYIYLDQVEIFSEALNSSPIENNFLMYTHLNPLYPDENEVEERTIQIGGNGNYLPYYWTNIWVSYISSDDNIEEDSNGLFIPIGVGYNAMTVEGLKKASYQNFGFYASELMNVHTHVKAEGNVLKRMFMAIVKAFLSLVDAIVNFFLKVPIFKQILEGVISWIMNKFDLEYDLSKGVLKQFVAAILITIISIFFPPMIGMTSPLTTSTAIISGVAIGTMSAAVMVVDIANTIYSLYNTYRQSITMAQYERDAKEKRIQKIKQQNDPMNAVKEAYFGTLGSYQDQEQSDNLMYNQMFNPFDNMNQAAVPIMQIGNY